MCTRCEWGSSNELMIKYHDEEWGVPLYDDQKLFEFLVLEGFQAGLSWQIIMNKRENFRKAFDHFDVQKVAKYDERKIEEMLQDAGIIRNKAKILGTVNNAKCFIEVQREFGSFSNYMWRFVNNKPVVNGFTRMNQIPSTSSLSDEVSKDLKKRGFKFVGSTVIYSHLQATGVVNDHMVHCFRYQEIQTS